MANLVAADHAVVRHPVRGVAEFETNYLDRLEHSLREVMKENKGVGIAAPQIGVPLSAAIIRINGIEIFVTNLQVVESFNWRINHEGCLSLPGESHLVPRPAKIRITYQDKSGLFQDVLVCDPDEAAIIHHEYCHLQGVLIDDATESLDPLYNYKVNRFNRSFEQIKIQSEIASSLSIAKHSYRKHK
jgi:peptide deformylase